MKPPLLSVVSLQLATTPLDELWAEEDDDDDDAAAADEDDEEDEEADPEVAAAAPLDVVNGLVPEPPKRKGRDTAVASFVWTILFKSRV